MEWRERLKQLTRHEEDNQSSIWQAVFVMTGDEDPTKQKITNALKKDSGLKAVVPKRLVRERKNGQWHDKIKPLFPGYILLQGYVTIEDYYTLRSIPNIVRILKDDHGLYRIYPEEIEVINRLMIDGDLIGTSTAYQQGDSVVITEGPLLGMEGLITAIDRRKGRAKVKLSILGDERTVDVSIRFIESV